MESLLNSVQAKVVQVDVEECVVVLEAPVDLRADLPLWIAGASATAIHSEHDKVWLELKMLKV